VDEGKGVLLLVDMGSLTAFSEIIFKKTNIMTSSIENISTPLVIEAVRKSFLPEMTLNKLVEELEVVNPYIGRGITHSIKNKTNISKPKIIFTTCITGRSEERRVGKKY